MQVLQEFLRFLKYTANSGEITSTAVLYYYIFISSNKILLELITKHEYTRILSVTNFLLL